MNFRTTIWVILLALASACGTISDKTKTNCIDDNPESLILRWGGHNYKTGYLSGYQIDGKANLFSFEKKGSNSIYESIKIGNVNADRFCELLNSSKKYFVEIQALNAPGDSSNFIEYINPVINTNLRAVWNERFKTYGSREFRELYDSLNTFIQENERIMLQETGMPKNSVK